MVKIYGSFGLGSEDEEERLTPSEKKLVEIYRKLDDGRKECIKQTIKYFVSKKIVSRKRVIKIETDEKPLLYGRKEMIYDKCISAQFGRG